MNTFIPYPCFILTAQCLDYRRLGKQRIEAKQIYTAIIDSNYGWQYHPVLNMWRDYLDALKLYHNIIILEWMNRGYKNNMPLMNIENPIIIPKWIGDKKVHYSHRANLLRKDYSFYSQYGWDLKPKKGYHWPK